jgi:hypothetical protein
MSGSNQTIEITVSPTGEATVQTKGFAGSSCREASKFIEQALGERAGEQLTAEFYQQQPAHQQIEQK